MDASKRLTRLVREWTGIAHDRELSTALVELNAQFDRWERGAITARDLNDLIHRFHDGASGEIWNTYATNRLEPAVAFAVATGILRREEVPPELVQHLTGLIEFYEAERSASSHRSIRVADRHDSMHDTPRLLDVVALLSDVPAQGLVRGQVGTVVEVLNGAYEIEFSDDDGRTYAELALTPDQLLVLRHRPPQSG